MSTSRDQSWNPYLSAVKNNCEVFVDGPIFRLQILRGGQTWDISAKQRADTTVVLNGFRSTEAIICDEPTRGVDIGSKAEARIPDLEAKERTWNGCGEDRGACRIQEFCYERWSGFMTWTKWIR
jgi:hypothetical protein